MENPIGTGAGRAARPEHYILRRPRAWQSGWLGLLALGCALWLGTACSGEDAASAGGRGASAVALHEASGDTPTSPIPSARTDPEAERPVVLFVGTSLTAGYGLREDEAFPALIQQRIDAAGLDLRVVNAGVSGDTSAGGLRRLGWLLRLPIAVLVLELGANDMLRGQDPAALEQNLSAILERTIETHPDARILIAGMRAAPNLGADYVQRFDRVYPNLAERHRAALVPFLLDGVAGVRRLNQADGIHPTAEGHRMIAERIWQTLSPMLRQARSARGVTDRASAR